MSKLPEYHSRGVRALIILHERYLRRFYETWQMANASGVKLLQTDDPSYASMGELLRHVLSSARNYMTWTCDKLWLPDPEIHSTPEASVIEAEARAYLEHLLEKYRLPLKDVGEEELDRVFDSRWGVPMAVEAMLEHAILHTMRHRFQLMELLEESGKD